jgi:AraC-like DNA-binding protein
METGNEVKSPETVRYQRRRRLPGVELRSVFDSSRCYRFYSTGFEFLVPTTWRGEVWHQRRKGILEPGWVLAAHPGDVFASERVLQAGSWHSLTIDADALAELVCDRARWDRVRLRPFALMSPPLRTQLSVVMQAIQSAPMEDVRSALRSFLAAVACELGEGDALAARTDLPSRAAERFACFRGESSGCVPLAELASETGQSRFQALRAFKRRFGLAPHAYQLRVRLGLAQKSLRDGIPPAHVAAELGFVDQSHFTRHFKQLVGVTPARYVRGIIQTPTAPRNLPPATSRNLQVPTFARSLQTPTTARSLQTQAAAPPWSLPHPSRGPHTSHRSKTG